MEGRLTSANGGALALDFCTQLLRLFPCLKLFVFPYIQPFLQSLLNLSSAQPSSNAWLQLCLSFCRLSLRLVELQISIFELKTLEPFTRMTKVYPNASFSGSDAVSERPPKVAEAADTGEVTLTVWKKSLLFNCNGFTVFDCKGDLVFRVDNYMEGSKGEILLMDANGKPLLTIRRKKMSLGDCWLVYEGETSANPALSVRKSVNILKNKCLAYVIPGTTNHRNNNALYEVEGSYSQRSCAVYDDRRRLAAEIRRKEAVGGVAFGTDVFRLVVQLDSIRADFAMALVILLDQMFR